MMRTSTSALATLVDVLGVLFGIGYLSGGLEEASLLFGGTLVTVIFAVLLGALLAPRYATRIVSPVRFTSLAAALCIAVPTVAFLGSLDLGVISSQERLAIFAAVLVGALIWAALKVRVFPSLAEQPRSTIERDAHKSGARPPL